MTDHRRVTDFVVHYSTPEMNGENWSQIKDDWNQNALDAWLKVARQRGLNVTVRELTDSHYIVAIVEVDGHEYALRHLGRRMELQAEPR
ncbi:hypothetical protein GZH49_02800 [Nocardia terpenica]|uniref:hypothetical protein n=1 Tax=Nocardia terpenica TaxID=455432 RepID=UPI002FE20FBE